MIETSCFAASCRGMTGGLFYGLQVYCQCLKNPTKVVKDFLALDAAELAHRYYNDDDRGFQHSMKIWDRCAELIGSPFVTSLSLEPEINKMAGFLLLNACIFHDVPSFFGYQLECENASAELAYHYVIWQGKPAEIANLLETIIVTRYNPVSPLAKIFRLAHEEMLNLSPTQL